MKYIKNIEAYLKEHHPEGLEEGRSSRVNNFLKKWVKSKTSRKKKKKKKNVKNPFI